MVNSPSFENPPCEFPRLVDFMALDTDHDFVIFRRFHKLQLYNLLDQQRRLILLEKDVLEHAKSNPQELDEALTGVTDLLGTYNNSLLAFATVSKISSPPEHMINSLKSWSKLNRRELQPIIKDKTAQELVTPLSSERGYIHRLIDSTPWLNRLFETKQSKAARPRSSLMRYPEHYIRKTEHIFINVSFCVLVLAPIAILPQIRSYYGKLILVVGAILLTTIIASGFSDSAHKSSLAVMAGYTSILVVFLSNTIPSECQ